MMSRNPFAPFASIALTLFLAFTMANGAAAQTQDPPRNVGQQGEDDTYTSEEIIRAGHRFFGSVSQGLASAVEGLFARQGRPNGYILGEEAGGAIVGGLRYGEGILRTRNAGDHKVYWQGPSLGWDFGADGARTMILVYNLNSVDEIYNRFVGAAGAAYLVGGFGVTVMSRQHVVIAPIRAGVGARLGVNVGYLKFTHEATWNPF
jgi:hypothetical protein